MGVGQDASSEPSKQSQSESQTNPGAMHFPSWQRNSSEEHVLGAAQTDGRQPRHVVSQHQPVLHQPVLQNEDTEQGEARSQVVDPGEVGGSSQGS